MGWYRRFLSNSANCLSLFIQLLGLFFAKPPSEMPATHPQFSPRLPNKFSAIWRRCQCTSHICLPIWFPSHGRSSKIFNILSPASFEPKHTTSSDRPTTASLLLRIVSPSHILAYTMSLTYRYAAQRCARQLRSAGAFRPAARIVSTPRRCNSTEAAAAPENPKIAAIVDQISQLTLLETADLVSSLKVRILLAPKISSSTGPTVWIKGRRKTAKGGSVIFTY